MKIKVDKRYLKFCAYVAITCMTIYLFTVIVDYAPEILNSISDIFGDITSILSPIIVALIISYLLYGPMNSVEKSLMKRKHLCNHKMFCRTIGLLVAYLGTFGIIIALVCGLYFMIGGQISNSSTIANIFNTITDYFDNNSLSTESVQNLINSWNLPFGDFINDKMGDISSFISTLLTGFLGGVGEFILAIGSNIFSFMVSLVLSIYLLISYEYFLKLYDKLFFLIFRKTKVGKSIRHGLSIINRTFSKYIHGQLIEAFLVFILSTIALTIVGIDYAFVIGIICGVCNLIPYIGPFVGIVFAGFMALLSGDLWAILWAVIALMIVQQIDCNILCPNIVGDIVGLNAAFTLIAISIGGDMAGLLGMLIAVPVAASLKQLIGSWFSRKMDAEYIEYSSILHSELEQMSHEDDDVQKKENLKSKIKNRKSFKEILSRKKNTDE